MTPEQLENNKRLARDQLVVVINGKLMEKIAERIAPQIAHQQQFGYHVSALTYTQMVLVALKVEIDKMAKEKT